MLPKQYVTSLASGLFSQCNSALVDQLSVPGSANGDSTGKDTDATSSIDCLRSIQQTEPRESKPRNGVDVADATLYAGCVTSDHRDLLSQRELGGEILSLICGRVPCLKVSVYREP